MKFSTSRAFSVVRFVVETQHIKARLSARQALSCTTTQSHVVCVVCRCLYIKSNSYHFSFSSCKSEIFVWPVIMFRNSMYVEKSESTCKSCCVTYHAKVIVNVACRNGSRSVTRPAAPIIEYLYSPGKPVATKRNKLN